MSDLPSKFYAVLDRDSIYDSLFDHCSPATIFRVGRTCRSARLATQDYRGRAFNIHEHFKRFFTDPFGFRLLQARTQAVVSGSSALQFMDRTVYPDSDLDIFVASRNAAEVCDWIVYHGGRSYHFVPTEAQIDNGVLTVAIALQVHRQNETHAPEIDEKASFWDFYDSNRIRQVLNFKSLDGENRDVQVIVTHNTPMECILSFHSTVVMNMITHFAAYSLYPKGTFEEGLMLPCDTREVNHEPGIEKYKERGWKVTNSAAAPFSDPKEHAFVLGKRCVGDQSTWVIHFDDVSDVLKHTKYHLPLQTDPITLNTFSLTNNEMRNLVEMRFSTLRPPFFENRYTACPETVPKIRFWFETLRNMEALTEDSRLAGKYTAWDMILTQWNATLMQECTCVPGKKQNQFRVCPAFISLFFQFGPIAEQHLTLNSIAHE